MASKSRAVKGTVISKVSLNVTFTHLAMCENALSRPQIGEQNYRGVKA